MYIFRSRINRPPKRPPTLNCIFEMKIVAFICVALFYTTPKGSQKDYQSALREIFYDLPVEDSRSAIINAIEVDPRFVVYPDTDTSSLILSLIFESCRGDIKTLNFDVGFKPISSEIRVIPTFEFRNKGKKLIDATIVHLKYTFLESEAAEKTFDYYWNKIKQIGNDTFDLAIGERFEPNYLQGKKIQLHKKQRLPCLSVLKTESQDSVTVFIVFERKGK